MTRKKRVLISEDLIRDDDLECADGQVDSDDAELSQENEPVVAQSIEPAVEPTTPVEYEPPITQSIEPAVDPAVEVPTEAHTVQEAAKEPNLPKIARKTQRRQPKNQLKFVR